MSLLDRITENLSVRIQGDEAEADEFAKGKGDTFYRRTQDAHPKALMVRPSGATWDYNPVPVRPDVDHGEVGGIRTDDTYKSPTEDIETSLDVVMEDLDEITGTLFG